MRKKKVGGLSAQTPMAVVEDPPRPSAWQSLRFVLSALPDARRRTWLMVGSIAASSVASLALPFLLPALALQLVPGVWPAVASVYIGAKVGNAVLNWAGSMGCVSLSSDVEGALRKKLNRHAAKVMEDDDQLTPAHVANVTGPELIRVRTVLLNDIRWLVQSMVQIAGGIAVPVLAPLFGVTLAPLWLVLSVTLPMVASAAYGIRAMQNLQSLTDEERQAQIEAGAKQQLITPGLLRFLRPFGRELDPAVDVDGPTDRATRLRKRLNKKQMRVQLIQEVATGLMAFLLPAIGITQLGLQASSDSMVRMLSVAVALVPAAGDIGFRAYSVFTPFVHATWSAQKILGTPVRRPDRERVRHLEQVERAPVVQLQEAAFSYLKTGAAGSTYVYALSDIDLTTPERGLLAIVGTSGAGKSTLAKLLADEYDPMGGHARVDLGNGPIDREGIAMLSRRRLTAYVDQETKLYGDTLLQALRLEGPDRAIELFRELMGDDGATVPTPRRVPASEEVIAQMLRDLGLDELVDGAPGASVQDRRRWQDRPLSSLSGGERQRVAIAAYLLADPKRLLVLDEPTNHLGPVESDRVFAVLRREARKRPIVVATHDFIMVERLAVPYVFVGTDDSGARTIVERAPSSTCAPRNGHFARHLATAKQPLQSTVDVVPSAPSAPRESPPLPEPLATLHLAESSVAQGEVLSAADWRRSRTQGVPSYYGDDGSEPDISGVHVLVRGADEAQRLYRGMAVLVDPELRRAVRVPEGRPWRQIEPDGVEWLGNLFSRAERSGAWTVAEFADRLRVLSRHADRNSKFEDWFGGRPLPPEPLTTRAVRRVASGSGGRASRGSVE